MSTDKRIQRGSPCLASRQSLTLRMDASGRPTTINEDARSVEVIASTEQPVWVMDWEESSQKPKLEILLMSGCRMPRQVPLLDTHSRESVHRVLGSFRDIHIADGPAGPQLVGRIEYSQAEDARNAWIKTSEGHLTDVSVGYDIEEYALLRKGESIMLDDREFHAREHPLRIVTRWALKELSLCPIGADTLAKTRQQSTSGAAGRDTNQKRGNSMKIRLKKRSKRRQQLESLHRWLRARRSGREDADLELAEVELVDEANEPIAPEDLSEVAIEELIDELEVALEEEQADPGSEERADGEPPEEEENEEEKKPEEEGQRRKPAKRSAARRGLSSASRIAEQARKEEQLRIVAIGNLARAHNISQTAEHDLIERGVSVDQAKAEVLDMLHARRSGGPGVRVSVGRSDLEKFRSATRDAIGLRCGLRIEKPAVGALELRGRTMPMLAMEMLQRANRPHGGTMRELMARALTTTDLPMLLVDTQRRVLMEAFEQAPETWHLWCGTGTATDFKKNKAVGLEGDFTLLEKPESGEYTKGHLQEFGEEWFIREFGRKMAISRQSLINDDLNALVEIPRAYGEACARLIGDIAFEAMVAEPNNMGDGKPLFSTEHNNLYVGAGGPPTVESIGQVVTGMSLQKNSYGFPITIVPRFFLAPVAMKTVAEQFFGTQLPGAGPVVGTGEKPLIYNPYGGDIYQRIYDRRLDAHDVNTWFMAAERRTVVVYFLDGVQSPYIEEQIDFDSDAIVSKVRMDVGAKAMSWLTMAKAAPTP